MSDQTTSKQGYIVKNDYSNDGFRYIDFLPDDDEDVGRTVAVVDELTLRVVYFENSMRSNKAVSEAIQDAIEKIKLEKEEEIY